MKRPRSIITQAAIDALGLILTMLGLTAFLVGCWALSGK